jgi:hypothetical protein
MSRMFDLTNDRPWLKDSHVKRRSRSLELGKRAIEQLVKKGEPVTYTTIAEQSKVIDPEGRGIHPNTIRTNEQLYNCYKQHSKTYKQKENSTIMKQTRTVTVEDIDYRKIAPDRNVKNVQRKYMKLSKEELVQRLILAEQYIADNNTIWVANHFEMFK